MREKQPSYYSGYLTSSFETHNVSLANSWENTPVYFDGKICERQQENPRLIAYFVGRTVYFLPAYRGS